MSTEDVIEIEYMPVTSFSDESKSSECPAWVGALNSLPNNILMAGCYNGQLRAVNATDLSEINTVQAHDLPIRSLSTWSHNGSQFVATASKDNTAKCWLVGSEGQLNCVANLESAVGSIETVESFSNLVLTGDWGGNIFAYDISKIELPQHQTPVIEKVSKKRRKNPTSSEVESIPVSFSSPILSASPLSHQFTIHAHSQAISGFQMCSVSSRLFTASWDHSIKQWDIERQECVHTIAGTKVATSLSINSSLHLIATSHSDGRVRLWDSRSREGTVAISSLFRSSSQSHWVSQVKWMTQSTSPILCTSDYDGAITVWDTRSPAIPLSSREVHQGKALCLEWKESDGEGKEVFSGGSDCCIKATQLNTAG